MRASVWLVPLILGGMMVPRTASSGQAPAQEAEPRPPSAEEKAYRAALEALIAQNERVFQAAKSILDSCNDLKGSNRVKLDAVVGRRRIVERELENDVDEPGRALLNEQLAVVRAEEKSARLGLAAAGATSAAAAAWLTSAEDDLAESRARRDALTEPGKASQKAREEAHARSSRSRITATVASEDAAEAGVEAAEAELAAARSRLKAARSETERVKASEKPAGPTIPFEIKAAARGGLVPRLAPIFGG